MVPRRRRIVRRPVAGGDERQVHGRGGEGPEPEENGAGGDAGDGGCGGRGEAPGGDYCVFFCWGWGGRGRVEGCGDWVGAPPAVEGAEGVVGFVVGG